MNEKFFPPYNRKPKLRFRILWWNLVATLAVSLLFAWFILFALISTEKW